MTMTTRSMESSMIWGRKILKGCGNWMRRVVMGVMELQDIYGCHVRGRSIDRVTGEVLL